MTILSFRLLFVWLILTMMTMSVVIHAQEDESAAAATESLTESAEALAAAAVAEETVFEPEPEAEAEPEPEPEPVEPVDPAVFCEELCAVAVAQSVAPVQQENEHLHNRVGELQQALENTRHQVSICQADVEEREHSQRARETEIASRDQDQQQELDQRIGRIAALEDEIRALHQVLEDHKVLLKDTEEGLTKEVLEHKSLLEQAQDLAKTHQEVAADAHSRLADLHQKSESTYINFALMQKDALAWWTSLTGGTKNEGNTEDL